MKTKQDPDTSSQSIGTSDSEIIEKRKLKKLRKMANNGSKSSKSSQSASTQGPSQGDNGGGNNIPPKRMSASEFARKAATKSKLIPKIPSAAGVAIMIRLKETEGILAKAAQEANFMTDAAGRNLAVAIYLMLIHERDAYLQTLQEAAGSEPAAKSFPNLVMVGVEILAADEIPWRAFQTLVEKIPQQNQVEVKTAKPVAEEVWNKAIMEEHKPLVQAVGVFADYIGVQLNEKAIAAKAGIPMPNPKGEKENKNKSEEGKKDENKVDEGLLGFLNGLNSPNKKRKRQKESEAEESDAKKRKKDPEESETEEGSVSDESGSDNDESKASSNSDSDGSKTPIIRNKKSKKHEVVLEASVKIEEANGAIKKHSVQMFFNGSEMRVKRPTSISFEKATELLLKKGKGPAKQAAKELTPLIPKMKRERFRWASLVIAASGHDLAAITGGTILCKEIRRGEGAATQALIKACLKEISNARPEGLNSRKAALFVLRDQKERKASDLIVELALKGVTSRFDWNLPDVLIQPVPFFLNIISKLLTSLHGVSILHQKSTSKELDDIIELNDNCCIRDADSFLAEVEEMVRIMHCPEFCAEKKKPISLARAALSRALKAKDKSGANVGETKHHNKANQNDGDSKNLYDALSWLWWQPNQKGKQSGSKGKGGKGKYENDWNQGKDRAKFDNVAWLRKIERYKMTNAAGETVEIKPLLHCRWVESRQGCNRGDQCQFSHEKAQSFSVRWNATVDSAFDTFIRWAATKGYTVVENPEAIAEQKGKGKNGKGGKGKH